MPFMLQQYQEFILTLLKITTKTIMLGGVGWHRHFLPFGRTDLTASASL